MIKIKSTLSDHLELSIQQYCSIYAILFNTDGWDIKGKTPPKGVEPP